MFGSSLFVLGGVVVALVGFLKSNWIVLLATPCWCLVKGIVAQLGRYIYLLWFHPMAKYPGPKLAAVSEVSFENASTIVTYTKLV